MTTTSLTFDILAKDNASRTFQRITRSSDGLHKSLVSIGRVGAAGVAAGAAAGFAGLAITIKTGLSEVSDYQTGLARLQAGLKSTGDISGNTAKHMEALASKIQDYSGQTDDSIVATEQLLLTFTNIRNVAGKNNKIFDRTTKIAADMAARLGGDASGAAIQLGKALQDPVKGIAALHRVGVDFDAGQTKLITHLVKTHQGMAAQKVILRELTKEFGGSAKAVGNTFPGQLEKLKRGFEDFSQSVVTKLMPGFLGAVHFLQRDGLPALRAFANEAGNRLAPIVSTAGDVFRSKMLPALRAFGAYLKDPVVPALRAFGGFLTDTVIPAVLKAQGAIAGALGGAFRRIAGALKGNRDGLHNIWVALKTVTGFVLGVWVKVYGTVLKKALVVVGNAISWTVDILGALGRAGGKVTHFFSGPFVGAVRGMAGTAVDLFKHLADVWFSVVGTIVHTASKAFGWLPFGIGGHLKDAAAKFDAFRSGVDSKLGGLATDVRGRGEDIGVGLGNGIWTGLQGVISAVSGVFAAPNLKLDPGHPQPVVQATQEQAGHVRAQTHAFTGAGIDLGKAAGKGIKDGLDKMTQSIVDTAKGMVDKIRARFDALKQLSANLAHSIADTMRSAAGLTNLQTTDSLGAAMAPTIEGIKSFLANQLKTDRQFRRTLRELHHRGLSDALYKQLAQAGPEAAGATVAALAAGSRRDIRQVSGLNRNIGRVSRGTGLDVSGNIYGQAIRAAAKDQREATSLLRQLVRETKADDKLDDGTIHKLSRGIGRQLEHIRVVTDTGKQDRKQGRAVVAG